MYRRIETLEAELVSSRLADARAAAVQRELGCEVKAMQDCCHKLLEQRNVLGTEVSAVTSHCRILSISTFWAHHQSWVWSAAAVCASYELNISQSCLTPNDAMLSIIIAVGAADARVARSSAAQTAAARRVS